MSEQWGTVHKGDRVEIDHTGERGVVYEVWKGMEDTVEVALDSGSFTCVDPPNVTVLRRGQRMRKVGAA